jgi:2-hydroxychromene-2-carboxylate isomerase
MLETIDVYFSFRGPYSYLATPELLQLQNDYEILVSLRPVLPIAVRSPEFFSSENAKRARYIGMDWLRRAEFLGMAGRWPKPDPIVQDLTTLAIAKEQPYIHRLTRLGVEAQRRGEGIEFAKQVSHLIFGGTKDWHLGDHLENATAAAGLDLGRMDKVIEGGDHAREIEANQIALERSGHWGVPTMVFRDEPFFGQDRIGTLRWRLDKCGIEKTL